jgi:hypothetical protein
MEEVIYRHKIYGDVPVLLDGTKKYLRVKSVLDCVGQERSTTGTANISITLNHSRHFPSDCIEHFFKSITASPRAKSVQYWLTKEVVKNGDRDYILHTPDKYRIKAKGMDDMYINLEDLKNIMPDIKDSVNDTYIKLPCEYIPSNNKQLVNYKTIINLILRRVQHIQLIPINKECNIYGMLVDTFSTIHNLKWEEDSLMYYLTDLNMTVEDFKIVKSNYFYTTDFKTALTTGGIDVLNKYLNLKPQNKLLISVITKGEAILC